MSFFSILLKKMRIFTYIDCIALLVSVLHLQYWPINLGVQMQVENDELESNDGTEARRVGIRKGNE